MGRISEDIQVDYWHIRLLINLEIMQSERYKSVKWDQGINKYPKSMSRNTQISGFCSFSTLFYKIILFRSFF